MEVNTATLDALYAAKDLVHLAERLRMFDDRKAEVDELIDRAMEIIHKSE